MCSILQASGVQHGCVTRATWDHHHIQLRFSSGDESAVLLVQTYVTINFPLSSAAFGSYLQVFSHFPCDFFLDPVVD